MYIRFSSAPNVGANQIQPKRKPSMKTATPIRLTTTITEEAYRQWEMNVQIADPSGQTVPQEIAAAVAEKVLTDQLDGNTPDALLNDGGGELELGGEEVHLAGVFRAWGG